MAGSIMSGAPPRIIAFYSYKGGSGRSIALANLAHMYAFAGLRVLAVDFDLEAPGLHRKLLPTWPDVSGVWPERATQKFDSQLRIGVLDLLLAAQADRSLRILEEVSPFSVVVPVPMYDKGGNFLFPEAPNSAQWPLWLLPAGRMSNLTHYWRSLSDLEGSKWSTSGFHSFLADRLREWFSTSINGQGFDIVLVDSRAGATDLGTIASGLLPDVTVVLATRADEGQDAAEELLSGFASRPDAPLDIVYVLSRLSSPRDPARATDVMTDSEMAAVVEQAGRTLRGSRSHIPILGIRQDPEVHFAARPLAAVSTSSGLSLSRPVIRDYLALARAVNPSADLSLTVRIALDNSRSTLMAPDDDAASREGYSAYIAAALRLQPRPEMIESLLRHDLHDFSIVAVALSLLAGALDADADAQTLLEAQQPTLRALDLGGQVVLNEATRLWAELGLKSLAVQIEETLAAVVTAGSREAAHCAAALLLERPPPMAGHADAVHLMAVVRRLGGAAAELDGFPAAIGELSAGQRLPLLDSIEWAALTASSRIRIAPAAFVGAMVSKSMAWLERLADDAIVLESIEVPAQVSLLAAVGRIDEALYRLAYSIGRNPVLAPTYLSQLRTAGFGGILDRLPPALRQPEDWRSRAAIDEPDQQEQSDF